MDSSPHAAFHGKFKRLLEQFEKDVAAALDEVTGPFSTNKEHIASSTALSRVDVGNALLEDGNGGMDECVGTLLCQWSLPTDSRSEAVIEVVDAVQESPAKSSAHDWLLQSDSVEDGYDVGKGHVFMQSHANRSPAESNISLALPTYLADDTIAVVIPEMGHRKAAPIQQSTPSFCLEPEAGPRLEFEKVDQESVNPSVHSDCPSPTSRLRKEARSSVRNMRRPSHPYDRVSVLSQDVIPPPNHCCVLEPHEVKSTMWNHIIAFCVIYVCWVVPFKLGFSWWRPIKFVSFFGTLLDVVFWLDMIVSFRTAYVANGMLIKDPKLIAKQYLRFWFWIDIVANIPWEFIVGVFANKTTRKSLKLLKWLKLSKLLRLATWRKVLNVAEGRGQYMNVVVCSCTLIFAAHLTACTWVGTIEMCEAYPSNWEYSKDVREHVVIATAGLGWRCTQVALSAVYFEALHTGTSVILGHSVSVNSGFWSAASNNLTAFEGSIQSDTDMIGRSSAKWSVLFFLMTAWQLAGLVIFGYIVATLGKIVMLQNWREASFWLRWDAIQRELEEHGDRLPTELSRRIREYFRYRFQRAEYGALNLMDPQLLTPGIRSEVAVALHQRTVSEVAALSKVGPGVLAALCCSFQLQAFMTSDYIYRAGEPPLGLHIVESGVVELVTIRGEHVGFCEKKQVFGDTMTLAQLTGEFKGEEEALYLNVEAARAALTTRVLTAPMNDLRRICRDYPDFLRELVLDHQKRREVSACSVDNAQHGVAALEALDRFVSDQPFLRQSSGPLGTGRITVDLTSDSPYLSESEDGVRKSSKESSARKTSKEVFGVDPQPNFYRQGSKDACTMTHCQKHHDSSREACLVRRDSKDVGVMAEGVGPDDAEQSGEAQGGAARCVDDDLPVVSA